MVHKRLHLIAKNIQNSSFMLAPSLKIMETASAAMISNVLCRNPRGMVCNNLRGYTTHEVYYEDNKEDGLQEAPSDCEEQSDRQFRCWVSGGNTAWSN